MKPGLLDILACPICKYYPLKLYIFKWETPEGTFKHVSNIISSSNYENLIEFIKNLNKEPYIKIEKELISDELIREPSSQEVYLNNLYRKKETFTSIIDRSESPSGEILKLIQTKFFDKLKSEKSIDNALLELNILNWFSFGIEIENGIISCDKCKRWYPIEETIPQMLPDELRNEKKEIYFLEKWNINIPKNILNEGKPFNIK